MADAPLASVIICTRDRADSLRHTLLALRASRRPESLRAELVIVDNGSRDDTAAVAQAVVLPGWDRHLVHEPSPGQARARNRGLAQARGRMLLFLDDDVRPSANWLEGMCQPLLAGTADAVAGGVRLAPELERPWMTRLHRTWLAATDFLDPAAPIEMVGANMAFARHVLDRVPAFDPELGPGGPYGQSDDSLFSWQLREAGFRLRGALHVAVDHHFDPVRLLRTSFHRAARHRGRTLAYLAHHWRHEELGWARLRRVRLTLRLLLRRLADLRAWRQREGMPVWEMEMLERIAFLRQWPHERRRPRHYARRGLARLRP